MKGTGSERTFVVTGATGAIGGAAATTLTQQGHRVVLLLRDEGRAQQLPSALRTPASSGGIETIIGDLSRMASIRAAAATIRSAHPTLDGVIHCAAVFTRHRETTPEGLEKMFATNHLGPFLLTLELLPLLRAGGPSRVVTVSAPSTTELDFSDLQSAQKFSALRAFGASKTANLLFAYALARREAAARVASNVFFPGLVKSGLMKDAPAVVRGLAGLAAKRPEEVAPALVRLATDPALATETGKFYKLTKEEETSKYSRNEEIQLRLWEISERLVARQPAG